MSQISSLVAKSASRRVPVVTSQRYPAAVAFMIRQQNHNHISLRCAPSELSPSWLSSSRHVAYFSSESGGGVRGWMESRKERQEHDNYMKQMERLSNMERLTLENYQGELRRGMDSWAAKISFMQTKEMKLAQEVIDVVSSFIDVLGPEGTADDLINMDRLQRLKVATASNKTVEEIGIMVAQMQNMDLMQRTLRKRRLDGKAIPPKDSIQQVIQKDALSVMSKAQKGMMKDRQKGMAKRMARKKR